MIFTTAEIDFLPLWRFLFFFFLLSFFFFFFFLLFTVEFNQSNRDTKGVEYIQGIYRGTRPSSQSIVGML